jgi:hypothetical protein
MKLIHLHQSLIRKFKISIQSTQELLPQTVFLPNSVAIHKILLIPVIILLTNNFLSEYQLKFVLCARKLYLTTFAVVMTITQIKNIKINTII